VTFCETATLPSRSTTTPTFDECDHRVAQLPVQLEAVIDNQHSVEAAATRVNL
jgi:hypothetical protein